MPTATVLPPSLSATLPSALRSVNTSRGSGRTGVTSTMAVCTAQIQQEGAGVQGVFEELLRTYVGQHPALACQQPTARRSPGPAVLVLPPSHTHAAAPCKQLRGSHNHFDHLLSTNHGQRGDRSSDRKGSDLSSQPSHLAPDETARPLLGHCARLAVTQRHQVTDHTCLSGRVSVDGHGVPLQQRHAHVQDQHLRDELDSQAHRELWVAHHTPRVQG